MATKKPELGFTLDKPKTEDFEQAEYYFDRDEKILRLNLQRSTYAASIEDFCQIMGKVIN